MSYVDMAWAAVGLVTIGVGLLVLAVALRRGGGR